MKALNMRWPDDLVRRISERAAATGSNRSELVRRWSETGLAADEGAQPTLAAAEPEAPEVATSKKALEDENERLTAEVHRLKRDLAEARQAGVRRDGGNLVTTPAAARSPFAGGQTCGNGQHGKTTKAGNCEKCGAYVGRS